MRIVGGRLVWVWDIVCCVVKCGWVGIFCIVVLFVEWNVVWFGLLDLIVMNLMSIDKFGSGVCGIVNEVVMVFLFVGCVVRVVVVL